TVERVRGQVVRIVGSGEEVTSGQIPFTPRAKKVLELALREALSLGHNHIGTEHILLALVRGEDNVATRILLDFDAGPEKIRNEVIRMLSGPSGRRQPRPSAPGSVELDPHAQRAVELAKREAASLGHEHVGTEHLLLGLQLSGRGVGASVLQELGVTIERSRPLLVTIAGSSERPSTAETPLSPSAQTALEQAKHEALNLGAPAVGTEHLLLSLAHSYEGVLGRILLELGTSPQEIRLQVLRRVPRIVNRAMTVPPRPRGLEWHRAALMWRPEGLELRVPLRMSVAAMAAFAGDEVWSKQPLAGLRREIWTGWLALASPTLLEDVGEPAELRQRLDGAVRRALDNAERDGGPAAEFLERLRADP
ncbi:MAG TPA: Clp protease N-terminal domain-containing protein, partial [Solirubrobacteraceae bacterium]|nr:Clp protease N-terminal domain-containing protein [Solirubrobacteraceae bacterium]